MILTIITLAVAIIGTLLFYQAKNDIMDGVGLVLFVCGGIVGFAMLCIIIIAHIGVNAQIEENRIEYNALCQRYEIITSEYEDVSKSDVIKDIAEWNKKVYSTKHWAYNPWTNWFYSKRVADDLKMIERNEE
jgi:hypothetical protein